MGRNRKFVLEDDLQQAVWMTILRGSRPPSAKWEKRSSPSAVSKPSQAPKKQDRQNPKPGKVSSSNPASIAAPTKVQRESVSPDEALAAARARVAKFESALRTVGEDGETFSTLMAALKKAQSQAQERPIPDRVAATRSFLERSEKRVEGTRRAVGRAKEELAKAEALVEKEEALFKDGHQWLRQLLEEKKVMPSPFAPPPVPSAGVATEISRMQAIIDSLQAELTRLRGSVGAGAGACEDEPMMDLPHAKKTRLEGGAGSKFLAVTSGTEVA